MTDTRPGPAEATQPESPLGEAIEAGIRRATTVVVIAASIVGLAIYARPGPPRYQAFAVGSQIVRVDTRTGTVIGCEGRQQCVLILRRGQRVTRNPKAQALPKPAAAIPAAPAAGKGESAPPG